MSAGQGEPTLSLCVIARDEAVMLPACLASVDGIVDEVIVVDTGSTDQTAELARGSGAVVVDHVWVEDFSAARNAGLAAATGDWILLLDADERLVAGAGAVLRRAIARGQLDCGLLPLHNASTLDAAHQDVLGGRARIGEPVRLARLFRRTEDLRWEGVIHEQPGSWLAAPGRRLAEVEAPIVHLGNVGAVRSARAKAERNLRLLQRRCALRPEDCVARTYLARELLRAGRRSRGFEEGARAWRSLEARMAQWTPGQRKPAITVVATLRAFTLIDHGRPGDALAVVDQARAWGVRHPNLAVLTGAAVEAAGGVSPERLEAALDGLKQNLRAPPRTWAAEVLPGATGTEAQRLVGELSLLAGEPAAALAAFDQVLAEEPGHRHATIGRVAALVARGRHAAALAAVEPLLAGDAADPWLLAGLAAAGLGRRAEARMLVERASQLPRQAWRSPRLRRGLGAARAAIGLSSVVSD